MIFPTSRLATSTLALGSALVLLGCNSTTNQNAAQKPSQPQSVGMANPASVHCVNKGGKLVIAKDKDGNQFGMCHLPDGTQIEEWQLFRRDNPTSR